VALASAGLGGCLGDDGGGSAAVAGARLGPVRLANCRDWKTGRPQERRGTIEELEGFAGGPVGPAGGHGATLPYDKAYQLFENYCSNDFARGFKLYKLYTRAAAFQSLREP
jgi:hypothetical protein